MAATSNNISASTCASRRCFVLDATAQDGTYESLYLHRPAGNPQESTEPGMCIATKPRRKAIRPSGP